MRGQADSETRKREALITAARATGLSIDTEGGLLCAACASVNLDSEYLWLGLHGTGCYNCLNGADPVTETK